MSTKNQSPPLSGDISNSVAYHNGNIHTVSASQPHAEAFIVSSTGTFTHVGTNDEILAFAKKQGLTTYNLKGQFVMPGLHDAHVHLLYAGYASLNNVNLPMDSTTDNVAAHLKAGSCMCEYAHSFGDWLVANLYRIDEFDRECLDQEYPETPVILRGGAGHAVFLNTAALVRAGYDLGSEREAEGHQYFRRPDGSLTGEMSELAMNEALLSIPQPGLLHVERCLQHSIAKLHSVGVTSLQEASSNTAILHALRGLEAEKQLKMDIATHIVYAPEWLAEERYETLRPTLDDAASFQSKHVATRFVKIMLDGVPLPPYFTHASLTTDGNIDETKIQVKDLAEAVSRYDAEGMTIKIHCTGHGSTRRALDVFEAVRKKNPSGPRHEIAHCSGTHPDDYRRFAQLDVTAEMSPSMFFRHPITQASGGMMDWNFPRMIKEGAHVTIGSDWINQEPDMLPAMAGILEGIANEVAPGLEEPERTRKAGAWILETLTLRGAKAVGREKETGSIEFGKKANFIVVDKDLSLGEFEGAKVRQTWFEGAKVYDARGVF